MQVQYNVLSSLQGYYLSVTPRWDAGTEGPVSDQGVAASRSTLYYSRYHPGCRATTTTYIVGVHETTTVNSKQSREQAM